MALPHSTTEDDESGNGRCVSDPEMGFGRVGCGGWVCRGGDGGGGLFLYCVRV